MNRDFGATIDSGDLARPSNPFGFLAKAAPFVIAAVVTAGLAEVGCRLDSLVNADVIQTLQNNWDWTRMFTSHHAGTVIWQNNELAFDAAMAVFGGIWGMLAFGDRGRYR